MEFKIKNAQIGEVIVFISDEDSDLISFKWYLAGGKGNVGRYISTRIEKTTVYLHRIIAQRMGIIEKAYGEGRSVPSIDHINGDKFDNRRENLRLLNRKQQMMNSNDGLRSTNKSGYRGVSYIQRSGQWYASVMVNGKTKSLGYHPTIELAVAARRKWDEGLWEV